MTEDEKKAIREEARYEALMITLGAIIAASPNRADIYDRIGTALNASLSHGESGEFKQSCIAEYLDKLSP